MEWLRYSIDYGIIGILSVMSVVAVGLAIERFRTFQRISPADFPDKKKLEMALTEKLHIIATIGSNAPYIGLLGTVLGIMLTFSTMGSRGFMDSGAIMSGLALALKATAAGLFVAIPSVTLYNLLLRRVKVILMQWDIDHG